MTWLIAFGVCAAALGWSLRTRAYRTLARRRHARCLAHITALEIELGMVAQPRGRMRTPRQAAAAWQGAVAAQQKAQADSIGAGATQEQWTAALRAITAKPPRS